ncbi:ABC transporter substrate-binding protein [Pseudonocardia sp. H11422]|uniref:ABC transporter substrate-binding protein n=1 Tax=Pseudonocardia sp. H11422 TaxID=2835866 RepID=UPI0027E3A749|nr:ABC transporter substrate-binding protein [Pseudonocardia sp. H11422]
MAGVVLALVTALLLAACGGATASSGTVVADGELTAALQFAPRSGYAIDTDDAFVLTQLGATETLVATGEDKQPLPRLATGWTRVDPLTWRFELRPGVSFHDGTPLTGAAVAGALTWLTGTAAPPRAIRGIGLTAAADGESAVRLSTRAPDPILPLRLTSPNTAILAPSAYAGGPATPPSVIGTGTGPMRLDATQGAQSATLTRNDAYWGGRPALARVQARFIPDPAARAIAIQAGDVQVAQGIPEASLAELQATDGIEVQTVAAPRTVSLFLNQSAAPFSDVRLREAVERALDRPALAEQALAGAALPASDLFGPAVPWGSTERPPGTDVDAARALLAQAGHGPDNPLSVRLWTYPNRPELPTLAAAVQGMLAAAGIESEIRVTDYATLEPEILGGRYDLFLLSRAYLSDLPDAAGVLASDYTCDGSYNLDRYCSPEFDALVAGLSSITEPARRQEVFRQAAAKLVADSAGVPLVHSQDITAIRGVSGHVPDPQGQRLVTTELARTG